MRVLMTTMARIISYSLALATVFCALWADPACGLEQPLILEHADQAESHWRDDRLVTILEGQVHFIHGTMHLRSQRATWHQDEQMVVFDGQVSLEDTAQSLRAQRLTYLKLERKALADGQVVLTDSLDHMELSAGHVEYLREEKLARADLKPRLIARRQGWEEPVIIEGGHMEWSLSQKEAVVADRVVISQGQLVARCGRARYLGQEDRILLEEGPVAEEEKSLLKGQEMVLHLVEDQVRRIDVEGDSWGQYVPVADSAEEFPGVHQMTAQRMSFFLEDERVDSIRAEGNATSVYMPSQKESTQRGENRTSGDRLEIFLQQEKVERAVVEGGALGYYVNPREEPADTARYGAQRIEYLLPGNELILQGEAFIDYGDISLNAYQIVYHTETQVLTAQQMSSVDPQVEPGRGRPILKEDQRELVGSSMTYNLGTQRGRVIQGQTEFEKGHYQGASIRKVDEDVLKADHGVFTTCDRLEEPHYHFYSRRMKIILKDKVIAKPVVLYIGRIPAMILPFYVFPIKRGRHSGFLIPRYGNTDVDGRYLKSLGYYLAPSQHWDATAAVDIYERTGWLLNLEGRYAVRYLLNGSLASSYKWDERYYGAVLQKRRRWDLRLSHLQNITPTVQLRASGTFIGQNDRSYYQDISDDPDQRMDRNLHSFLSLDKSWSGSRIGLELDQRWDLDADMTTRYLPSISFQRFEKPIWPARAREKGEPSGSQAWYRTVYYRYSARFINSLKDWTESQDGQTIDRHEEHQALDQILGLRAPLNLFGSLTLTPAANYRETWFDRDKVGEKNVRRGDYDASLGASTTIYGLAQPHIGSLTGIRHVVKPSLSFSWRPDFPGRDDYYSVPFIHSVGGPQKTMGIDLANQFQVKLKKGDAERKYNLADVNIGTSYNFRAETQKLSNLISSLRVHPTNNFNITLGTTHDFYEPGGNRLQLFNPRLTSFSVDTRLSLSGGGGGRDEDEGFSSKGWRLSLAHRYAESRGSWGLRKSSWLSGGISFQPTDHWRVDYSGRYDLVTRRFVSQRIEFYRDLHCWEARLVWEPSGYRQGYYFRINIKALPEIKLERVKGIRG